VIFESSISSIATTIVSSSLDQGVGVRASASSTTIVSALENPREDRVRYAWFVGLDKCDFGAGGGGAAGTAFLGL